MFFVPGFLISAVTFPGVIVHEIAHRFFLDVAKIPVYDVRYFKFTSEEVPGYVEHGEIKNLRDNFFVSIAPLILNTLLCAILTYPATIYFFVDSDDGNLWIFALLMWLGISIGMHAFPSDVDMEHYVDATARTRSKRALVIFAKALAWIFKMANILRFAWFDFFYALGVSMILPCIFGAYENFYILVDKFSSF
jgi:Putative zincin peptidase